MTAVLLKAFSFLFIILIGIFLRAKKIVDENNSGLCKKLLVNVTLPAAIVINFSRIENMSVEMLGVTVLGILTNVIMMFVGGVITRNRSKEEQALYILCLPAVNIGAFCLPFVQSFLSATGSVTACMFDVGNSIMCTGVTYAVAAEYTSEGKRSSGFDFKSFFNRLIKSVPLDTYILMFLLTVAGIRLPAVVTDFITPISNANTFVAMMMIGLLFHLELRRNYIRSMIEVLCWRIGFAGVCALICYYMLPFQEEIRQTLALISFGPMSAIAPAYTGNCGGDEGLASCINSVSIICSLIFMTIVIGLLGLG